jgi:two-component system chemotaxis response regulator CheY
MRILVVEDSPVYRHLLSTQLAVFDVPVETAADAESALPMIAAAELPMVLLIDWELPGMSGLELLHELRRLTLKHYVYAIVLTARSEKADVVEALNAGADDYLVKPFHEQEFHARILVAKRLLAVHEELIAANERLECLASQDPLTELFNRRALMRALNRERLRAQRKATKITLVMCDIDKFKQINDLHGHGTGDEVLKLVARDLRQSCRGSDFVARIGGDEFLIVLPDADADGGVTFVTRVQERLRERNEVLPVLISLSFGIAEIDVEQSEYVALAKTDAALYSAKHEGRDRYFIAGQDKSA